MKICDSYLRSLGPLCQGRYHNTEKLSAKESPADYEKRTWKNRLHVNADGYVFIPPLCFKNCLSNAAKFVSEKIPGKRNATYTKHFEAGVLVVDPLILAVKATDVAGETRFVPADGKRGGGTRVERTFPIIPQWEGVVRWLVLDDTITEEVFERHLQQAGAFVGVGSFRVQNNGIYGRFEAVKCTWSMEGE